MFKQRVLTALILVPLVVLAIAYLPQFWVAALVGALMLVCAWEWALFVPLAGPARVLFVVACGALMVLAHPAVAGAVLAPWILALGVLWWGAAALWLSQYPRGFGPGRPAPPVRALLGVVVILACYQALWQLHAETSRHGLVYLLLVVVWATDTGGYFVGKRFGRRKLAPLVSPNKTWEGLWGGVLLAGLLAALGSRWIDSPSPWWIFMLLGLAVALMSVVGDLSVSMFKRQCGIKDTGQLFPGHGGALDRLDSLLSAAPILLLGYLTLGYLT